MATERNGTEIENQLQLAQNSSIEFFNQLAQLWWDSFVAMTRYQTRIATSLYEVAFRGSPASMNQALEVVYRENLDLAKRLHDAVSTERRTTGDTAPSVKGEFVVERAAAASEADERSTTRDEENVER